MNVVSLNNVSLDGNVIRKGASGGGGGNVPLMTEVTWQELKDLRDNGQLTAGHKYRMIDYDTYTSQEGTQSAMHPFDLILTALDNKTLSEECSAIHSARDVDGYFANSNLGAWRVWYCLDNDVNRFAWASQEGFITEVMGETTIFEPLPKGDAIDEEGNPFDMTNFKYGADVGAIIGGSLGYKIYTAISGDLSVGMAIYDAAMFAYNPLDYEINGIPPKTFIYQMSTNLEGATIVSQSNNGKGVIYRLIDDRNNDVCYDFKNIQFNFEDEPIGAINAYTFAGASDRVDGSLFTSRDNIITPIANKKIPVVVFLHDSISTERYFYNNVVKNCNKVVMYIRSINGGHSNTFENCNLYLYDKVNIQTAISNNCFKDCNGEISLKGYESDNKNRRLENATIIGVTDATLDSYSKDSIVYHSRISQKADGTIYSYTDEDIYNAISATKTE